MFRLTFVLIVLAGSLLFISGCINESTVYGTWENDKGIKIEFLNDNTGVYKIDASILNKMNLSQEALSKAMSGNKFKWSLKRGNILKLELDEKASYSYKLENNTLTKDGKVRYTKISK